MNNIRNFIKDTKYIQPALKSSNNLLFLAVFLIFLSSGLGLITPFLSKFMFDKGIIARNIPQIFFYGTLIFLCGLSSAALSFAQQSVFTLTGNRFALSLKTQVIQRILNLPFEFFDTQQSGYLVSRIGEADSLGTIVSPSIFYFFASLIEAIGATLLLLRLYPVVCVPIVPFLFAMYFVSRWMRVKIRATSQSLFEKSAISSGLLQETIATVTDVKQFGTEKAKSKNLYEQFALIAKNRVRQSLFMAGGGSVLTFLQGTISILVSVITGIAIVNNTLSIGDYVAIALYTVKLVAPVIQFSNLTVTLQPLFVSMNRLKIFFETKTEQELWGKNETHELRGAIQFTGVTFSYDHSKGDVLKDCSFQIVPGDCVTLYGGNGAGKSTIFKLLLGFYHCYKGYIEFDGTELHKYEITSLRRRIGIVSQNLFLFTGTLSDNVRIAKPDATDAELKKVLDLSGCARIFQGEITTIPISELGRNLSGGQKQAVAIARCMLRNPDVILFDEATAHLDVNTRQIVLRAIKEVFNNKTRILITQDQNTANISNRILYLEKGSVTEIKPTMTPQF